VGNILAETSAPTSNIEPGSFIIIIIRVFIYFPSSAVPGARARARNEYKPPSVEHYGGVCLRSFYIPRSDYAKLKRGR